MIKDHGVQLRRFDDSILRAQSKAAAEVLAELASSDPLTGRIHESPDNLPVPESVFQQQTISSLLIIFLILSRIQSYHQNAQEDLNLYYLQAPYPDGSYSSNDNI